MSTHNKAQQVGVIMMIFTVAFLLFGTAMATPPTAKDLEKPTTGSGKLRLHSTSSQVGQDAVLLSADAEVTVNAVSAAVTLTQTFKNNTSDWMEGTYVFPLPENAAVDRMKMQIGDKVIIGKIRKKAQAKAIYKAAVANGQKAALLDQVRDNLFSAKVGNIPPDSEVRIELHYVQSTHYDNGVFSLRLPTTYTPRYIVTNDDAMWSEVDAEDNTEDDKASNEADNTTHHAAHHAAHNAADNVAYADTPLPKQHFTRKTEHPLKLSVHLDAGYRLTQLHSPTHTIQPQQSNDAQRAEITLTATMDRDFVLNWQVDSGDKPLALAFSEQTQNGYFTSLLFVPPKQAAETVLPREIVFIIDTSGSMSGAAIRQAKAGALQALGALHAEDAFNIVEFNSDYSMLFSRSQAADAGNLATAKAFINGLQAGGGTEMAAPLQKVLTTPPMAEHFRQVVFLTDGSVSNEKALFRLIHRHLDKSRLFTVGIGSAPNHFFMRQAASFGRGTFTYIGNINEVSEKMNALFQQLQYPTLTDIQVGLPSAQAAEIYPNPIADLYLGQPVVAHIKTDSAPTNSDISISGQMQGQPWVNTPKISKRIKNTETTEITEATPPANSGLDKLWAREKINRLNTLNISSGDPHRHDAEIEKLGLAYQLVTAKTAFVAVEERISRDTTTTAMKTKAVPNQMPAGNSMSFPRTATSSTLTLILGIVCLWLAGLLWFVDACRHRTNGNRYSRYMRIPTAMPYRRRSMTQIRPGLIAALPSVQGKGMQ